MSAFKPLPCTQLNLDHPLSRGLVGCWLMNENSGNKTHDYSYQGNTGTLSGFNDPPIATSGWNAGPHGGALAFDKVDDYIDTGKQILSGSDDFTIICLLKSNGIQNTYSIPISQGHASFNGIAFQHGYPSATNMNLILGNGTGWPGPYFGYNANTDFTWKHLVATKKGTTFTTYKDGIYMESASRVLIYGAFNFTIGQDTINAGRFWNGLISSVSIYNRALSAEEIAYLYAFPYCMFEQEIFPAWLKRREGWSNKHKEMLLFPYGEI